MVHVVLTGSTGSAGAATLATCIASDAISRISILSRLPVKQAEGIKKASVVILHDFETYDSTTLEVIKGADACIWALGVPSSGHSIHEYRKITVDNPLAAIGAFYDANGSEKPFKFIYISGAGVTRKPGRFTQIFGRVKGEVEVALLAQRSANSELRVFNVRPGFIDEEETKVKEGKKTWSYAAMDNVAPAFRTLIPDQVAPTRAIAECTLTFALSDDQAIDGKGVTMNDGGRGWLIENVGVRRLGIRSDQPTT